MYNRNLIKTLIALHDISKSCSLALILRDYSLKKIVSCLLITIRENCVSNRALSRLINFNKFLPTHVEM